MTARVVVHGERQVERLAREGIAAETRAALARRLLDALAPEVALAPTSSEARNAPVLLAPAPPETVRIALDVALARVALDEPLLAGRAGDWSRTVDAVDAALGVLRAAAATDEALAAAARAPVSGTTGARVRMLRAAMNALDAELARAGLFDGRAAGSLLARALTRAAPDDVVRAVGHSSVVARGVLAWDAADVRWWRALDLALARRGGGARVELPAFDREIDAERERDPLETIADDLARALDDAPLFTSIAAPLGDMRLEGDPPREAREVAEIRRAADAHAQARAAADAVHAALASGVPIDRIAVAFPRVDDDAVRPLARALDEAGIVAHAPRGPAPKDSGLVACALAALDVGARALPRRDVAVLLRARYLDAPALTGEGARASSTGTRPVDRPPGDRREATRRLLDLARALEETPSSRDPDPLRALVATTRAFRARTDRDEDGAVVEARASLAQRIGEILARPAGARTYLDHVRAARALFGELGLGPRIGAGARTSLAHDAAPSGIARAELRAAARDAHAWEALTAALESWEAAALRLGLGDREVPAEAFRHHLARALEVGASPLGAARAGAVRCARLADLAGEPLDLLVLVDANDGVLPASATSDPLVSDALVSALRDASPHGAPASPALLRARDLASLALAASEARRIVFVCRARDAQGTAIAPAPLVAWLERGGVPTRVWRTAAAALRPLSVADARLAWLSAAPDHAAAIAPEAARRASVERRRESLFYDARRAVDATVGALAASPEIARALAEDTGAARPLAVTSLERAARCPFQGFAAVVLGARDAQRRGELPDAREEGTLLHEALAVAFRATLELWAERPRDAAAIEARALAAVDELFARELVGSVLRDVVLARARDGVRAVLAWSLADDRWDFALAEQPFGESGAKSWPALRISVGDDVVQLRGTIDRVDIGHLEARVRALDYKRSKRSALDGERDAGRAAFQVPLYALAAARALGRPGADGAYVPASARDLRPDYRPKDAFAARWAELLAEDGGVTRVERTAVEVIAGLRRGGLAPVPADPGACAHCDMRGGCRQPRFAVAPEEEEG